MLVVSKLLIGDSLAAVAVLQESVADISERRPELLTLSSCTGRMVRAS